MAKCNGCGCTYERACAGGCSWVYESLPFNMCSSCAGTDRDLVATLKRINHMISAHGNDVDLSEIKQLANRAHRRHGERQEAYRSPDRHKAYREKMKRRSK